MESSNLISKVKEEKNKLLNMIKYNKSLMKRINININDYREYKEYLETNSPIEIEIKPVNKKYGKFINIKKEEEIYYHIYFNNNKEEIKRNFSNENEKGGKFKIIIDYQVKSFEDLFYYCESIETINFKKFYRNNINNMKFMFYGCSSLKGLNLNNFITDNVTNMRRMFYGCSKELVMNIKTQFNNIKEEAYNN